MQPTDDRSLLRDYCENQSHDAFAELVGRHINLVYSVALRYVGNPRQAEEITHAVFIILAKKAGSLRHDKALSSWLFQATHLTANNLIRSEARRQRREQEAYMQSTLDQPGDDAWKEIAPLLDTAVARLNEKDRRAIVLRFYEGRNLREIGMALGANEESAKKRVTRALEKLRKYFFRHGVDSSTAVIAESISANSVYAAPAGLAKAVSAVAVAKGAAASASTLTLMKGALKIMAWTKAKTTVVAGVIVLFVAATTTVTVKEVQAHRIYPWEALPFSMAWLSKAPPQVKITSSRFPGPKGMGTDGSGRMMGLGQPLWALFPNAYHIEWTRIVCEVQLPTNRYDFIANLRQGSDAALRREIERKFGLATARKVINTNVLLLTLRNTGRPGLTPAIQSPSHPGEVRVDNSQFQCEASPVSYVASYFLEAYFQIPIVDGTGLAGTYDITLKWTEQDWEAHNLEDFRQNLLDQLGLDLIRTNMPVEMLVVTKAK